MFKLADAGIAKIELQKPWGYHLALCGVVKIPPPCLMFKRGQVWPASVDDFLA